MLLAVVGEASGIAINTWRPDVKADALAPQGRCIEESGPGCSGQPKPPVI
jgi:hypothetical protein